MGRSAEFHSASDTRYRPLIRLFHDFSGQSKADCKSALRLLQQALVRLGLTLGLVGGPGFAYFAHRMKKEGLFSAKMLHIDVQAVQLHE